MLICRKCFFQLCFVYIYSSGSLQKPFFKKNLLIALPRASSFTQCMYTAISKKIAMANSRYWNRKEYRVQSQRVLTRQRMLLLNSRGIMMNLHFILCKVMLIVTNSLCFLNPTVPFGSSENYRL